MAIDTNEMREQEATPARVDIYALCDELDAARAEVERLSAMVAALREALEGMQRFMRAPGVGKWAVTLTERALASTAQAAAEHDARVRAEAIEECAQVADDMNRVYWDPVGGREWRDSDKESIGRRIRALRVPPPPEGSKKEGES